MHSGIFSIKKAGHKTDLLKNNKDVGFMIDLL